MRIYASLAALALAGTAAQPALAAQDITKRANVAPDVSLAVSNVQGRVDITAWDRNEVELVARLESDEDELEFEADSGSVSISVDRPDRRHKYRDDDDAILRIRAPKRATIEVTTVSANTTVSGIQGEQRLESVSGSIRTESFDAPVELESVSGSITLAGNGGRATVETANVSGATVVSGIRGDYQGETVSGSIRAAIAAAREVRAETVSGSVELELELTDEASVEMESVSGLVGLKLKPPVNAEFDLESFSGQIDNCFGPDARKTSRYTPGRELSFTQGRGEARVEIQTLSGQIRLCDR